MHIKLFDTPKRAQLLPLTFTRPVAEIRVGIATIAEKWSMLLEAEVSFSTVDYLTEKYPRTSSPDLSINGSVLPNHDLIAQLLSLKPGEGFQSPQNEVIAYKGDWNYNDQISENLSWKTIEVDSIQFPEDIFMKNESEMLKDFEWITKDRQSSYLSSSNQIIGEGRIFLEPGAKVEGAFFVPNGGVVYVGKDAEIMPGSLVSGSLAMCTHSTLKLGTKIYGATTLGPYCKVGGEVSNSVLLGYSSKAHDGFLGNSVLGEWCNLGADTNNSNLKNNYAEVKLWDYTTSRFRGTGLMFCGLIMGDHSKCGINTMFNTGTVVGVCSNLFGAGFPRNYVPSFAWGGSSGFTTYQTNKVFETAEIVFSRRSMKFDDADKRILTHIFNETAPNRFWEDKKS